MENMVLKAAGETQGQKTVLNAVPEINSIKNSAGNIALRKDKKKNNPGAAVPGKSSLIWSLRHII